MEPSDPTRLEKATEGHTISRQRQAGPMKPLGAAFALWAALLQLSWLGAQGIGCCTNGIQGKCRASSTLCHTGETFDSSNPDCAASLGNDCFQPGCCNGVCVRGMNRCPDLNKFFVTTSCLDHTGETCSNDPPVAPDPISGTPPEDGLDSTIGTPPEVGHHSTQEEVIGLGAQLATAPGRLAKGQLPTEAAPVPNSKWQEEDTLQAQDLGGGPKAKKRKAGAVTTTPAAAKAPAKAKAPKKAQVFTDALIPAALTAGSAEISAEPGLVADLVRAGCSSEVATSIACSLGQAARDASQTVARQAHQLRSGKPPTITKVRVESHRYSVDLVAAAHFVKLTHEAYAKLSALHQLHGLDGEKDAEIPDSISLEGQSVESDAPFHLRLFAMLLRYKAIQGHGFQAAAGPPVFELLRKKLGVGCECFASPLNAHFERCASAFPDVDGPFGSIGSFFKLDLKSGSYEANPPFVPTIMDAAARHMEALLKAAEAGGQPLSFTVFLPGWEETDSWRALKASPFLRRLTVVAAADHGFCDGASHQRRDPFRQSPYDTGVFFLQTAKAAAKWKAGDELEKALRVAMAECCPTPAAVERQRKQRASSDMEHWGLQTGATPDAPGGVKVAALKRKRPAAKEKAQDKATDKPLVMASAATLARSQRKKKRKLPPGEVAKGDLQAMHLRA
ncbi:hypothetical protein WJX72_009794 [[Myrmecia] bisecta]|uniref:PCIF1 WW domain-containing protein n=1 Tax=[Myrmecia] bisecta TaxID=41462 RepID=A0AAW1PHB5_9CHLO